MRTFLTIAILAIGLLFSVPALAGENCEVQEACLATFGQPAAPKAPVDDMVCIWFTQEQPGVVMLALYKTAPAENDQPGTDVGFEPTSKKEAHDRFCFGRWRLKDIVWLMVCGEHGYATRGIPDIDLLKQEGTLDVGFLG